MVRPNAYKVTSLFSGIGGLDLGFEYAGFKTTWANDISHNASKSYSHYFNLTPVTRDISEISFSDIPHADVIIGGPPCQAFSLVGKRRPDDERGKLVFYFLNIVKSKMPKAFVMENVPGITASRIGEYRLSDFLAEEFRKCGYKVTVTKLVATDYLVPQRRKRIFIMGALNRAIDIPDPEIFARECYDISTHSFDISAKAAIDDLGHCVSKGELSYYKCEPHSDFARLLRRNSKESVSLHECPRMSNLDREFVKHIRPGGNYHDIPNALATKRILKFKKNSGRTTTYGRLHPDRPAYTINTYFRRPNVGCHFHYREPRLITPREAMRFQSIPDDFNLCYNSQDERNSYIGNAVPPLLAHAIAWSVRNCLEGRIVSGNRQQSFELNQ